MLTAASSLTPRLEARRETHVPTSSNWERNERNNMNSNAKKAPRIAALAVTGLTAGGLAVALGTAPAHAAVARDFNSRMVATSAHPSAHGHAEYDVDRSGREFEIRIVGIKGMPGRPLTVRAHGDLIGKMTVNRLGRAHLDRQIGVPAMTAGNSITVRTSTGSLVSHGTLHRQTSPDRDPED